MPQPELDSGARERMMADVTADHAQRLVTMTQALKLTADRLDFLEQKVMAVEPRIDATEAQLTKDGQNLLANHKTLKEKLESNDAQIKSILEKNDETMKNKMNEM